MRTTNPNNGREKDRANATNSEQWQKWTDRASVWLLRWSFVDNTTMYISNQQLCSPLSIMEPYVADMERNGRWTSHPTTPREEGQWGGSRFDWYGLLYMVGRCFEFSPLLLDYQTLLRLEYIASELGRRSQLKTSWRGTVNIRGLSCLIWFVNMRGLSAQRQS